MADDSNDDGAMLLLLLGGAFLVLSGKRGRPVDTTVDTTVENLPRSLRNNNPGNIIITDEPWKGKIPKSDNTDGVYEQFTSYAYGTRAMIKNLQTYRAKYGLTTIREIITRWAPPGANKTEAYIDFVSSVTGFDRDLDYDFELNNLYYLVSAIAEFESGLTNVMSKDEYNKAVILL